MKVIGGIRFKKSLIWRRELPKCKKSKNISNVQATRLVWYSTTLTVVTALLAISLFHKFYFRNITRIRCKLQKMTSIKPLKVYKPILYSYYFVFTAKNTSTNSNFQYTSSLQTVFVSFFAGSMIVITVGYSSFGFFRKRSWKIQK